MYNNQYFINPFNLQQEQYFLGGLLGSGLNSGSGSGLLGMGSNLLSSMINTNSSGGGAASGALSGVASGAMFGPIGMAVGGGLGALSGLISGKKNAKEQEEIRAQKQIEQDIQSRTNLSNLNYMFSNSSNLPMAYGGKMAINPLDTQVGDFTSFKTGGTHESNPYGGIPQGTNSQGQMRTVEEGEAAFKFNDGKYIFSNRLKFE
jgi:hypothetical protein